MDSFFNVLLSLAHGDPVLSKQLDFEVIVSSDSSHTCCSEEELNKLLESLGFINII